MILALAACGKEKESAQPVEHPADAVKAEGYAYKADYLPVETDAQWGITPCAFTEDGFYATGYVKTGRKEIPEGATEEYEGQYDIYSTVLYFVTWDGKATRLSEFEPGKAPENTGNYKDFSSSVYLSSVLLRDDGTMIGVEDTYCNWFDGPDSAYGTEEQYEYYNYQENYAIVTYDQNGKELSRAPVDYDTENSYLSFWRAVTDENGNLLTTRDEGVVAFAADGSVAYMINSDNYINRLVRLKDGTIGAMTYGDSGMELCRVDTAAGQIGDGVPLPNDAWDVTSGNGGDYDLYYTSGLYLYGVKLGETKAEKLLNWIECDINGNNVSNESLYIREDGTIAGLLSESDDDGNASNQVFLITKVPADTLPQKQELVLAEIYADYEMNNKVVKFNRAHDNVRIIVKDYSEYNTEEDYSAGLTKLTTEIMAGNVPDLLDLNQLPYKQMAAKGFLEDLYPHIDADPAMNRGDFFPNVLKAMEVNGGLYEISSGFSVETLVGAASVVGDTPGWTYDEYYAALASMPEGCTPMELWYTKESVLNNVLYSNLDSFVDWTTGKVNFESDEFRQMLEFVNTFPTDVNWDDEAVTASTEERIRSGQQMLTSAYLYSVDSLLYNDMNFGGKSTYIGWPGSSGVGSCMQLGSAYGMSSTCADKEAAWEFLRTFLTEEGQKDNYNIPTNKKVFEKRLEEWMTPQYLKDADGNFILDENGEKIQEPRGGWSNSEDGEMHYIYSMTQEQADEVMNIIESCTKLSNYDTAIYDIVYEQAQAYFAGQKSIEEVMRLIQSKANIYVNEQR